MNLSHTFMLALLVLPLAACANRHATAFSLDRSADHPWQIATIDGAPALPDRNGQLPTLEIAGVHAGGSTGINRYNVTAEITLGAVSFSHLITTRMMGPPPLAAQEQAYLLALSAIRTWTITADRLYLSDADGAVRITCTSDQRNQEQAQDVILQR